MKLVRYRYRGEHYGALVKDRVVSLPSLAGLMNEKLPEHLQDFIALGTKSIEDAEKLLKNANENEVRNASLKVDEITLLEPIAFPPKIVCLGLNYRDHVAEQRRDIPDEPVIFIKPHTTIIGPNENIIKPSFVKQLDYEAELAIIIGRKAKNIPVSQAESHIFGYTILNDVSARDIQFKDKQWTRGKSFDTFAPHGTIHNYCKPASEHVQPVYSHMG